MISAASLVDGDKQLSGDFHLAQLCKYPLAVLMVAENRSKSHLILALFQPSDESVYQNHCQVNVEMF